MYLPSAFEETRADALHAMIRANPLATLVTAAQSGLSADHIPMQLVVGPGSCCTLRGHIARANGLWRCAPDDAAGLSALAVFQGPQVYISPSLYPTKSMTGKVVPTWDYAVVHAHGRLRFIHDPAWLLDLVSGLTDAHEAGRATPWRVTDAPSEYVEKMLRAIVGVELDVTRLSGKWKVSQNRNGVDRQGVLQGLRAAGDPPSRAVADLLEGQAPRLAGRAS